METRSMFSVNTMQTTNPLNTIAVGHNSSEHAPPHNQLHELYYRLLPVFSEEYPFLSKVFYLQLLLRENILIYTEDRVDARDIWLSINRRLGIKKPEIYVVDENFEIQEALKDSQNRRLMLYDVSKMNMSSINALLNKNLLFGDESEQGEPVSFIGIQSPHEKPSQHILDLFPIAFHYEPQSKVSEIVDSMNNKSEGLQSSPHSAHLELLKKYGDEAFDLQRFTAFLKNNYQIVMQSSDEEGFLKPALSYLEYLLRQQYKMNPLSPSKWKKMLKFLRYIGANRSPHCYKRMALSELVFVPWLIGSTPDEIKSLEQATMKTLQEMIPLYGVSKFEKMIQQHFWMPQPTKIKFLKTIRQFEHIISFFYPCSKFPDTASIHLMQLQPHNLAYRIQGCEKKLMSDHHYPIASADNAQYELTMEVMSRSEMIIHIGVACYDKNKNAILPIQVCRRQGSDVIFLGITGNIVSVKKTASQGLINWAMPTPQSPERFAYQKCIGIYADGQINNTVVPLTNIISNRKQPYSLDPKASPYTHVDVEQNQIVLSEWAVQQFQHCKGRLTKNKTVLMNHYEGSNFCIGQTVVIDKQSPGAKLPNEWSTVKIEYSGFKYENTGCNFFPECKFIRVCIMANCNSGLPQFRVKDKDGQFFFRNVTWR